LYLWQKGRLLGKGNLAISRSRLYGYADLLGLITTVYGNVEKLQICKVWSMEASMQNLGVRFKVSYGLQ